MAAPTLLIGLGGTGSKIVCRVANMVSPELKDRIGYAAFDTDINELRDIQASNPLIATIQTSTKLSVGEYLNIDTHARDDWFPVNAILNSKTLTEGAGQVRAISRLALDTAIRSGNMDKLHAAVENLYKVEAGGTEQALRVVIVSSLAGGTGSGLILPVALYLKNFLMTRFRQSANIVRGFFILPEVFFEVIRGQSERNNLMCNAYAAVRELDAFLMKGDGTLPPKYDKSVKIDFPRVGTDAYDEYRIRPYDFCFLFDAQNTDGRKLNNFNQYLDHAANCIYSQSIGPMNKRSNSSEDNTIRELCAQRGRNRYAGAGCSMLVYPVEDVKEYIALKWAEQTVSAQWLKFDRIYLGKLKEWQKQRSQGIVVQEIGAADDYIQTVETLDSQKDPFAISILAQCSEYDETGLNRTTSKAKQYISALFSYVKSQSNLECDARAVAQRAIQSIEGGADSYDSFLSADQKIKDYTNYVRQFCNNMTSSLAYTIFKAQSEKITKEKKSYQLETYLRGADGAFMHPNAVRYFLYQCQKMLEKHIRSFTTDVDDWEDKIEKFNPYDDPDTTEQVETIDQLSERKVPLKNKLLKQLTDDQENIKSALSAHITLISNYHEKKLLQGVIKEGLNYIQSLSASFEAFYHTFEAKIVMMNRRMNDISKKYQNCAGKTTRYVCASAKCLNALAEKIPYTGSAIRIDGDLADEIYSKVRIYAQFEENERPENGRYFNELFDQTIIGYYKKKMMASYGAQIDMDIIDAMDREIEIECGEFEPVKKDRLAKQIIESTRKLSTPFIERPMGEQIEPISACAYNPSIYPGDDSPRAALIAKELNNYGGTPDSDIGKNMIMFYQSIYGLRANRLSKFAPKNEQANTEGSYHKAYCELVRRIVPSHANIPIITPHIDKNWHLVIHMPDLDEDDQKRQETKIYKSFILGLIYGIIKQKPISEVRYLYKLELSNCAPESFVVSNKTPCDLFYEVLDALSINPLVVGRILDEISRLASKELNTKVSFESSAMYQKLKSMRITEYEKKNTVKFKLDRITIFDFPALIEISAPDNAFSLETATDILRVSFDIFHDYISSMTEENAIDDTFARFIVSQYRQFAATRARFAPYQKLVWFIGELKRVACERLRMMDLDEYAQEIDDIDAGCESEKIGESSLKDENGDGDDLGADEVSEINDIAGAPYVGAPSEPTISLADHLAKVDELNSEISSLKQQFATYSREFEMRFQTLSRELQKSEKSDKKDE